MSKKFTYAGLGVVSWTISILLIKHILNQGENGYNLVFWATLLGLPYWLYIFSKRSKKIKQINKIDILILLGIGLINTAAVNFIEIFAIKYTQTINYSFLIRTITIFTIIFAWIFLKEKLTKEKIILTFVIILGSYLLITNGQLLQYQLGDLLTILEAALISFGGIILGKMAIKRMGREFSSSAGILIGMLPVTLTAWFNNAIAIPQLPLFIIFLATSNALLIVFRYKSYQIASASYVTMIFSLTPILVLITAIPLFGESLGLIQIFGGVLIIATSFFVEKLKI